MKKYSITFNGREINAIGIFYTILAIIYAETKEEAVEKLYNKYEHITKINFTLIEEV